MIISDQLVRTDSHVRSDVVRNFLPSFAVRWMEMFNCVAAILFCGALTWYGWQIVETARAIDEHSSSNLQFPMWIYYAALPTGGALMAIRYAIRLIRLLASPDYTVPSHRPGGHELTSID
jgi:C4-dicarboxylate transporter DctQ subunit